MEWKFSNLVGIIEPQTNHLGLVDMCIHAFCALMQSQAP